jgi:hypothetical protein
MARATTCALGVASALALVMLGSAPGAAATTSAAQMTGAHVTATQLLPHSLSNPAANVTPPYNFETYTPGSSAPQCDIALPNHVDNGAECTDLVLADINYARSLEGVGAMALPSNWYSLSGAQQVLAVTNYERVDRGLPALAGLASALDPQAATGAANETDPALTSSAGVNPFGSIWAGGYPNVLAADYGWMYDDGYGGPNGDCPSPGSSGCWGHRDIMLSGTVATAGHELVAGAATATPGGVASYAEVLAVAQSSVALDWAWNPATEAEVPGGPATALPQPVTGMAAAANGGGYWLTDALGGVSAHGGVTAFGSLTGKALNAPINHIVSTPDGQGYWLVAADGGTFAFGDAGFYGSMGGKALNAPVVDIAPTADGQGYWLVAADGGVFAFGDAGFHGSMGGQHLNSPVVGIVADNATGGYWEIASDGGVFSFGAPFYGSTGGLHLNRPVNGMAVTADDHGYWFVASDGGIFSYGDAAFHGSTGGTTLNAPIVGMAADWATGGYWVVGQDGGVFSYAAPFFGAD